MKKPKYICAKCRLPFTRRWNANRHCNNKHYGEIENIISFTEYITNRKGSSIYFNHFYHDNNSYLTNVTNAQYFDNTILPHNTIQFSTIKDPFEQIIDNELIPLESLDQLALKYEEMQSMFGDMPEPARTNLIGQTLSSAIQSNNPIETMSKKVTDLRRAKTRAMMLNDLARYYGIDTTTAKEFLKLIMKQKEYSNLTNKLFPKKFY